MPHSLEEKQRVIKRLRRIKGQAEALERAVGQGTDCGSLLQQLAALRGASTSLMAEVLDSHLRETFGPQTPLGKASAKAIGKPVDTQAEIDQLMRIVRSYLK